MSVSGLPYLPHPTPPPNPSFPKPTFMYKSYMYIFELNCAVCRTIRPCYCKAALERICGTV